MRIRRLWNDVGAGLASPTNEAAQRPPLQAATEVNWLPIALVLLITFIAYSGTLWFQFVYDDRGQILANPNVHLWRYAPHYFFDRVWSFAYPTVLGNYYRPLFMLWLLINWKVFGPYPAGWHLMTVAVQVADTYLVFLLARRLTRDSKLALVAALIFGLDPIHIESVAWISGVTDPLLTLFLVPSVLCYLNWREKQAGRGKWLAASLFLYALSLLSKETGAILPAILFAYEWLWQPQSTVAPVSPPAASLEAVIAEAGESPTLLGGFRICLTRISPFIALTAGYLALRWHVLKGVGHVMTPLSISTVIFTWPHLLLFYFQHLVRPVGLSVFYDVRYITHPGLREFVLPLCALILLGAVTWLILRRIRKVSPNKARVVSFALVWILLPFVPLLDLSVLPVGEFAHDRYLYLPSIGLAVLAAMAIRRLRFSGRKLFGLPAPQAAIVLALALALGIGTALQDQYWANDIRLYSRGVTLVPRNKLARTNLGNAFGEQGYYEEAIHFYREVLAQDPHFWLAVYNMGYTDYRMGNLAGAEDYFRRAIAINSIDGDEYLYLGLACLKQGRLQQADPMVRHALKLNPEGFGYHFAMGMILKLEGNPQGALKEFKHELRNFPGEIGAEQQIDSIRIDLARSAAKTDAPTLANQ